jgi:hypothetical protein
MDETDRKECEKRETPDCIILRFSHPDDLDYKEIDRLKNTYPGIRIVIHASFLPDQNKISNSNLNYDIIDCGKKS